MVRRFGGSYRRINGSLTEKLLVTAPSRRATPKFNYTSRFAEDVRECSQGDELPIREEL